MWYCFFKISIRSFLCTGVFSLFLSASLRPILCHFSFIKLIYFHVNAISSLCMLVHLTHNQNYETEKERLRTLLTWIPLRHRQSFLPTSSLRTSCFLFDSSISNFLNVDCDCEILLRKIITSVIDIAEIKVAVRNIRL